MRLLKGEIALDRMPDSGALGRGRVAHNPPRNTDYQRIWRDLKPLGADSAGANNRARSHRYVVQQHGTHRNQAVVGNCRPMNDGPVPDANPRPDNARYSVVDMDDGAVLDVRVGAD